MKVFGEKGKLVLETRPPRAGQALQGWIQLPGKPVTQKHGVELHCWRRIHLPSHDYSSEEYAFRASGEVAAVERGAAWMLPLDIDIPAWAPSNYAWRIGYYDANGPLGMYTWLDLEVAPAADEQLAALEAGYTQEQKLGIRGVEHHFGRTLLPHERRLVAAMTPAQRAKLANDLVEMPPEPTTLHPGWFVLFAVVLGLLVYFSKR
jgi:hypothetical protein